MAPVRKGLEAQRGMGPEWMDVVRNWCSADAPAPSHTLQKRYLAWILNIGNHAKKDVKEIIEKSLPITYNYVNFSNIAARTLRKSLKANLREEASKRDQSAIRYFYWAGGEQLRREPVQRL
ncbi:unnamed protein product [Chilo suppressalis]|uniref:Uncharacterized protein n=1 Tax=Chilo suppressalis TaxID=168631 RepID=A0ABN8L7E1_CHISP|nr:unnamed protein product [Chilo suppressalis]